ncbi:MAG TPA: hypothetical protein VF741_04675 [Candidatus Aquilonibacter sp.]
MRTGASILAAIALSAALTIGVGAQQQTFSTARAGPTGPVPVITGQPVNANVYPYYPCNNQHTKPPKGGTMPTKGTSNSAQRNPCGGSRPSPRPSRRPSPRPS